MEVEPQPSIFICFNPWCSQKSDRVYTAEQSLLHNACNKWVLPLEHFSMASCDIQEKLSNPIDFHNYPIESILLTGSDSFREQLENLLKKIFNTIHDQFQESLFKAYNEILKKINERISPCRQAYSSILQLSKQRLNPKTLSHFINSGSFNEKLKQSRDLGRMLILDENQIASKMQSISSVVETMHQDFVVFKTIFRQDFKVQNSLALKRSLKRIRKKMSWVESALKVPPTRFTKNRQSTVGTKCAICFQEFQEDGRNETKMKNDSLNTLFTHIIEEHFKVLQEKTKGCSNKVEIKKLKNYLQTYESNKSLLKTCENLMIPEPVKPKLELLTLFQCIDRFHQEQWKNIAIVDRENINPKRSIYNQEMIIEVVSEKNHNLARGLHVLAHSSRKDAADIIIVMLLYEFTKDKDIEITLITRDSFSITLKELLSPFGVKINLS